MINRINLILRAKNITARQFAEEIGIQPSGMSHILGGRNNPSLDFAVKVLKRYPEIDANWLLLGKGAMYGGGEPMAVGGQQLADAGHPSDDVSAPQKEMDFGTDDSEPEPISKVDDYQATYVAVPPSEVEDGRPVKALDEAVVESGERVARILFIYNDNTYEELTPRR